MQRIIRSLLKFKAQSLINFILERQMEKAPLAKWGVKHGMYNMGVDSAYEYLCKADKFQITDIAHLIDQDFLLLGASKDHFIPVAF